MKKCAIILIGCLWACESQFPFPYQVVKPSGSPVAYLKLSLSPNTNSKTLIANGSNYVQVQISAYNLVDYPIANYDSSPNTVEVKSNGQTLPIKFPFKFSTTEVGTYSFSLRRTDVPVKETKIEITAVAPLQFQPVKLPVIFHYFNQKAKPLSNYEKDSISQSLSTTLALSNNDFGNFSGSLDPNSNDTGVRLQASKNDPTGRALPWSGINFIETGGLTFQTMEDFEDYAWEHCFWPPKKYLNVWVAIAPYFDLKLGGTVSWAYFPDLSDQSTNEYPSGLYGVMLHQRAASSITLSHEIGHMLSLLHVFGECPYDFDSCADTWNYARTIYDDQKKFSLEKVSCTAESFTSNNFMDYGPSVYNTFTLQQSLRIQNTLLKCSFLPTRRNGYTNGRLAEGTQRPTKARVSNRNSVVP